MIICRRVGRSHFHFTGRSPNCGVCEPTNLHESEEVLPLYTYSLQISECFRTVGGSVGLEKIREQALLDGGIPTQGLLVQDEQEAVELHQELVQHWKHRQRKEGFIG